MDAVQVRGKGAAQLWLWAGWLRRRVCGPPALCLHCTALAGSAGCQLGMLKPAPSPLPTRLQGAHLYGRRLVLEWAEEEGGLDELRAKTGEGLGGGSWRQQGVGPCSAAARPSAGLQRKLVAEHASTLVPLHLQPPSSAETRTTARQQQRPRRSSSSRRRSGSGPRSKQPAAAQLGPAAESNSVA